MFAGDVDQFAEYDFPVVLTAILPDGIVTSGAEHGSAATRQIRISGDKPGSNVPVYVTVGAIGGSQ